MVATRSTSLAGAVLVVVVSRFVVVRSDGSGQGDE